MEAASLPRAPPAVKAPIHTPHTGQHGDDGLAKLIPWSWPGGSHGATTPLPRWSRGSEPGSGLSAYRTGRGAKQGRTPSLHRGPAIMGSDPTRGRQHGLTGSTRRPGKNGEPPPPLLGITHTHTHTLLCKGHRIAPTLVLKYHRILWLSQLCRTRGAGQITAQAIWEMTTFHKGSGPYGRAMSTAQECGWVATQGWWGWKVPGRQEPLLLYGDKNTIKHEVREQLRSQMLDSLVQRRPRLFAGAHYTTCRRLVQPSIASFAT